MLMGEDPIMEPARATLRTMLAKKKKAGTDTRSTATQLMQKESWAEREQKRLEQEQDKLAELHKSIDKRQTQLVLERAEIVKLREALSVEPKGDDEPTMFYSDDEPCAAEIQRMELRELNLWRTAHSKRKPDGATEEEVAKLVADAEEIGRGCDEKRRNIESAQEAHRQCA